MASIPKLVGGIDHLSGTQLTSLASTPVQILTLRPSITKLVGGIDSLSAAQFTCFTSTKVQMLTPEELPCQPQQPPPYTATSQLLSLLALLVQKYEY
jgi:hypothetical protein